MSRNRWVLAVVFALGCESKEIDSESHFLCTRDSDCGEGTCIEGRCTTGSGGVGSGGRIGATGTGGTSGATGSGGRSGATASGGTSGASGTGAASGDSGLGGTMSSGGTGGASSPDGATNTGGTGGTPLPDGGTTTGGTGGVPALDGAAGSGGTGSIADASSGGSVVDAGIDASADAEVIAACSVTGTTLLTVTGSTVDQILLDGGYLYFHDGGGVSRVPRTGGSAARVASFATRSWPAQHAFVVDGSSIIWLEPGTSGDGSIFTNVNYSPKAGGPVTTLATLPALYGTVPYSSIWLGPSGSVFLLPDPTGSRAPNLLQVRLDGSLHSWGTVPIFYNRGNDVVFDGTDVFATGDSGVYIHVSNSGFDGFTSITGANAAQDIEFDGATMFIGTSDTSGYVTVFSAPKTGGQSSMLWSGVSAGIHLAKLLVDANYLYVVERMQATILRMNKDGTNPTEFFKGIPYEEIENAAMDDTCVYWSKIGANRGPTRTQSGVLVSPK